MGGTAHHTTPQAAVSNRSDIDIKIDIDIDIDIDVVVVSVSRFPTVSSSTVLHYLGANPVQRVFSTFCIELAPCGRFLVCPCLHYTAIQPREVSSMNLRGMAAESP